MTEGTQRPTPAALGGAPQFADKVNIVRPVLPAMEQIQPELAEILSSGMVTKGKYLERFETACAEHLGVRHAIAVSSCTSGLILVLRSLGAGGEVILPSFTFMASASAIVLAGLRPRFVDVDFGTTNIAPDGVEPRITGDTRAILAVHNFGNPADVERLQEIAKRRGLALLFDSAHGFGARRDGVPVGRFGTAEVFSLSPTKLVVAGEGGIVATNDDGLAETIRIGREYGMRNYDSLFAGLNARMPEMSAVMGYHSLQGLEEAVRARNKAADLYRQRLGDVDGIELQHVAPQDRCSYKDFSIVVDPEVVGIDRDALARALQLENIDVRKYYYPAVHRQKAYHPYADDDVKLEATEQLANGSLSLPIWSCMDEDIVSRICDAVERICSQGEKVAAALR